MGVQRIETGSGRHAGLAGAAGRAPANIVPPAAESGRTRGIIVVLKRRKEEET
ncbi:MAG: hypothetical protein KH436_04555 [Firmicutes bacterium]|nr:hypothetical protein [Bacillota bacterium]